MLKRKFIIEPMTEIEKKQKTDSDSLKQLMDCCTTEGPNGCLVLKYKIIGGMKIIREKFLFKGKPPHRFNYYLKYGKFPTRNLIPLGNCIEHCILLDHFREATDEFVIEVWKLVKSNELKNEECEIIEFCQRHNLSRRFVEGLVKGQTHNHLTGLPTSLPTTREQIEKAKQFLEENKIEIEMSSDEKERFLAKVPDAQPDAHWTIKNAKEYENGYPICDWNGDGGAELTYRVSGAVYESSIHGVKAAHPNPILCHLCGAKFCWWPNHLMWGSANDNSIHTIIDGNSSATLTEGQVDHVRRLLQDSTNSLVFIASEVGTTPSVVAGIRDDTTKSYSLSLKKHLPKPNII